ncbi:OmpA family protein [Thalassococcus halodurans]|uniref:OmpA family protein n=1 Tax=Thalassococcus halodurans TaxID=373675 RepID=A0A1H5YGJ5_9RHOB|nr:OmpA family protein [Thalassococcus halodurans]SEG23201.1 OmpA family protein [Thalassococcus halodurans]
MKDYFQSPSESCSCHNAEGASPHEILETLTSINEATGGGVPQFLAAAVEGKGPLAQSFVAFVPSAETLQDGDILFARDLFTENDPNIDIIGLNAGAEAAESYGDQYEVTALRADPEIWGKVAAAARALPFVGDFLSAGATSVGSKAGDLLVDPTLPMRNTLQTVQQAHQTAQSGIQTANDALDFGLRVARLSKMARQTFNGLDFDCTPLAIRADYNPPDAPDRTNIYKFDLRCKYETGGRDHATYPFRVQVYNNCFSVTRATILAGAPSIGWLNHRMTARAVPIEVRLSNSMPGYAEFRFTGLWNPADLMGRVQEQFEGKIRVYTNGRVRVSGFRGGLVSAGPVSYVSGPVTAVCTAKYPTTQAPKAEPAHGGGGGNSPAPRDPSNGKHIFFNSGSASSNREVEAQVQAWWGGMGPNLRTLISGGSRLVRVTGHADPTGNEATNRSLSHRRAALVAGMVRGVAGSNVRVQHVGLGSQQARAAGVPAGRSDRSWRRVTISVDGQ